ncbi:MAG: helix-turn-helix domain-containing protein [Cyclobacteriaceae bacterium]
MKLDIVTAFILLSIVQGLFVIFMLWRTKPVSKYSRIFLAALILCFAWYQLEFLMVRSKGDIGVYLIYGTRYGSWLLFGPLLWFYITSYLSDRFEISWRLSLHFIPFIVFVLIVPLTSLDLLTWRSVDYGMLTVFDSWNNKPITFPQYLYGSIFFVQFLHAFVYLIFCNQFLRRTEKELKIQFSNFDEVAIKWHKLFMRASTSVILCVSIIIIYQFVTRDYRRMADYFYVIPMSLTVYMLLYYAMKYPNLIFKNSISQKLEKYEKSSLATSASTEYAQKLKALIEDRKLYTQRELGLSDLAQEMGVSTHHLSQSINEILNLNFYELINQYRVEEAKSKIVEEAEKSLLQVAFEVGFNNKASFNNAFKKHVGMTPSKYRESV